MDSNYRDFSATKKTAKIYKAIFRRFHLCGVVVLSHIMWSCFNGIDWINMIKIILAILAITGYTANIADRKTLSYVIWLISNTGWAVISGLNREWAAMLMFIVYNGFCIYGIINEIK